MIVTDDGFEWDEAKDAANIRKHAIGFANAISIFRGYVLSEIDDRYEYDEVRETSLSIAEWSCWQSPTPIASGEPESFPRDRRPQGKRKDMKPPYARELTAEELARRSAHDIDLSDIPELGEEFFKAARLLAPHDRKRQMTIRIDGDVIDWFKAQGAGYQSRMNAVLRAFVNSQR